MMSNSIKRMKILRSALILILLVFGHSGYSQFATSSLYTVLLKDIYPGPSGSIIGEMTPFKSGIFFGASDNIHGKEPWFSNGTISGTNMMLDINPGPDHSNPIFLGILNNILYFAATGVDGRELWRTDGTPAGTSMVLELFPGNSVTEGIDQPFEVWNNLILFWGTSTANGKELYRTDGTAAGTFILGDLNPGTGSSYISSSKDPHKGTTHFYFKGLYSFNDYELYVTDGTVPGTQLIDLPGYSSNPDLLFEHNGEMYFSAMATNYGYELWKSNGTTQSTVLFHEFQPGSGPLTSPFIAYKNFFSSGIGGFFYDADTIFYLYKFDGTVGGMTILKSFLFVPPLDIFTNTFIEYSGNFYFTASDLAGQFGLELWKTNLTAAGTVMVKDINPGTNGSAPNFHAVLSSGLLMDAYHNTYGRELWRTNGTGTGTQLVKNILPNLTSTFLLEPGVKISGNKFVFSPDYNNIVPWVTDGTTNGTFALTGVSYTFVAQDYHVAAGKAFFAGYQYSGSDKEPFVTDGTLAGTYILKDINTNWPALANTTEKFVSSGNHVFFLSATVAEGKELWSTRLANIRTPVIHWRETLTDVSTDPVWGSLYPNPTTGIATINWNEEVPAVFRKRIYDLYGRLIEEELMNSDSIKDGVVLDITTYDSGIYLIHFSGENFSRSFRIVKE